MQQPNSSDCCIVSRVLPQGFGGFLWFRTPVHGCFLFRSYLQCRKIVHAQESYPFPENRRGTKLHERRYVIPRHAFRFRTSHRILRFGDALPFADSSLPITLPLPGSRNRIMRTAGPPVRQPANLQQKNDPNNVLLFSDIRQPAPRQAGKTVTGQDHALRLPRTALP